MKELGQYFRDTRIRNGVSIEEAAEDNELSASQLENIEQGNIKAFKDVYKLKEYMKNYAKYLGLDPSEVAEEFNDFLFEHTSKISLEDILEAKKRMEAKEEEKKIKSPYTKEYKEKFNFRPIIYTICGIICLIALIMLIKTIIQKEPVKRQVLNGYKEEVYEFTY